MSAGTQWLGAVEASRRRVPRFPVRVPIDVTVLRSGIPATVPGRLLNLCERGLAAVLAGELLPGETVGVAVRLPRSADPLRTRALVRHHDRLQCGMEFVALSAEQQAAIRHWADGAKAEARPEEGSSSVSELHHAGGAKDQSRRDPPATPNRSRRLGPWALLPVLAVILALIFWWRWNRSWEKLETGLSNPMISRDQPRVQAPADVMQKLLIYKVDPVYPAAARKARLKGIIVLRIVVGQDGSVVSMHPVNGPDVLVRSAMDAVRWWKYEPYRVNEEPTTVETTVAVEYKR